MSQTNTQTLFFLLAFAGCCLYSFPLWGQGAGTLTGGLQTTANYFIRDTTIGAGNTPQYDRQFTGAEGWLNLNYRNYGFDIGLRYDFYFNSNLPDPQDSYTGQGIGFWYIRKKIHQLDITAGYIYDQIGAGLIFRSYEERNLAIDNALVGLRLQYDLHPNWMIKTMIGRQRNPFGPDGDVTGTFRPVIAAFTGEGYVQLSEQASYAPGIGLVNRILDDQSMNLIVAEINTYAPIDSFVPNFNAYAASYYHTLNVGDLSWFIEAAYKSTDAIVGPEGILINTDGSQVFTTVGYSRKGFGLTLGFKRTENFTFRTSPNEILTRGIINFLPPLTRANTLRLQSRYNAATQELGELAFQADILYKLGKYNNGLINFSNITDLNGNLLFREIYVSHRWRRLGANKKWEISTGLQYQEYNQEVFEVKPGVPLVKSWVPFWEGVYRIDRKKSLRAEVQYQYTRQDFGQFVYALLEYSVAPSWTVAVSEMINVVPKQSEHKDNFFSASVSYTHRANKFIFGYFRQIEGIVCTGGVCRFEPAFNGARLTVSSSF